MTSVTIIGTYAPTIARYVSPIARVWYAHPPRPRDPQFTAFPTANPTTMAISANS